MMTKADEITAEGEPYMVFSSATSAVLGENLSAAVAAKLLREAPAADRLIALPLIEWATLAQAAGQ